MLSKALLCVLLASVAQPASDELARLMSSFSASSWETRAFAAKRLSELVDSEPALVESTHFVEAVALLLERENVATRSSYFSGQPLPPGQRGYTYDFVMPMAAKVFDRSTPLSLQFLRAAGESGYNAGSQFSRWLAREGSPMVVPAIELSLSDMGFRRQNAYSILGELVRAHRTQTVKLALSSQEESTVLQSLRNGLQDPVPTNRIAAIDAIVIARDNGAVPILTFLSLNDPDSGVGHSPAWPNVRKSALAALQKLQQ